MTADSWRGTALMPARPQAISASDTTNSAPPAAASRLRPDASTAMETSSRLYAATGTRKLPSFRHRTAMRTAHSAAYPAATRGRTPRAAPSLASAVM